MSWNVQSVNQMQNVWTCVSAFLSQQGVISRVLGNNWNIVCSTSHYNNTQSANNFIHTISSTFFFFLGGGGGGGLVFTCLANA